MSRKPAVRILLPLHCHPSNGTTPVRAVAVAIRIEDDPRRWPVPALVASWRIDAEPIDLRLPALAAPRATDGLWRHTCCELFVRRGAERGYREFNFSPSSEWTAYAFSAYREGMTRLELPHAAPSITTETEGGMLVLTAMIGLDAATGRDAASGAAPQVELRLNAAAVVEDRHGRLSYWALTHPDPLRPDFHHPDSFQHEIRHRPAHE